MGTPKKKHSATLTASERLLDEIIKRGTGPLDDYYRGWALVTIAAVRATLEKAGQGFDKAELAAGMTDAEREVARQPALAYADQLEKELLASPSAAFDRFLRTAEYWSLKKRPLMVVPPLPALQPEAP